MGYGMGNESYAFQLNGWIFSGCISSEFPGILIFFGHINPATPHSDLPIIHGFPQFPNQQRPSLRRGATRPTRRPRSSPVQQLELQDLDLDALELGGELSWQDPVDDSCWAHGEIPKMANGFPHGETSWGCLYIGETYGKNCKMDGKFFGLGFFDGSSDIFRFCLVKRWTWVFGVPLYIWACFGSSSSPVDHPITLGLVQRYDLYIAKVLSENRSCIEARARGKSRQWETCECLVGGLEHEFYFSIQLGIIIIPTDELHHFSER